MTLKTIAIKAFLCVKTHPDLAEMYNHDMECQVNVAQENGEIIEGDFEGVKWRGYTDGMTTWKAFRIPRNASTEPEYFDGPMKFDLGKYAEGIGMTGWDWKKKVSKWVAFDFDAILGHSEKHTNKLTSDELRRVQEIACGLDWVTVRYSTSGKGLHLYVMLDDVPTNNHTEHAALARAILGKMGALTGYDFQAKVDICGGNMWVWHRKMQGTNGLQLIKKGGVLKDVPENWQANLQVVRGVSKKLSAPTQITELQDVEDKFDVLCGQHARIKLDETHIRLITYLNENGLFHWWDADRHMLVTHTIHLKAAHKDLGMRGIFDTETKATSTHNCFLYPMRRGMWSVRRFTPGVKEHPSWEQDGQNWTRCFLNQDPSLRAAAHSNQGIEDPSGGYVFKEARDAEQTANALGVSVTIPPQYHYRRAIIKPHKDTSRIVMELPYEMNDEGSLLPGWLHKGNKWVKIFNMQQVSVTDTDTENYDDLVRHLVSENGQDGGWVVAADQRWHDEPINHVRSALLASGFKRPLIDQIVGNSILKPWTLVNRPFQSEYPGDRVWNRFAPQFRFPPSVNDVLHYPTWMKVLSHIGKCLDPMLPMNKWAKSNGITSGADYLKIWISSMIQYPSEPLPYLFIYGEMQESGKSTLHEAIEMLFNPGYTRVDHALQNPSTFNGELQGSILGVIEEVNLNKNRVAYDRIKDWVTSPKLSIHRKGDTPYLIDNTLHFIQCANERENCPIFPGDTRITMLHVLEKPSEPIPKPLLMRQLEKEAPDFLAAIINLDIPESDSRLRVPVIETEDKVIAASAQRTAVQEFIEEQCHHAPGYMIGLAEFFDKFQAWLDPADRPHWSTKNSVSKAMPDWVVKGRYGLERSWFWGNISFTPPTETRLRLISVKERLMPCELPPPTTSQESPVSEKTS